MSGSKKYIILGDQKLLLSDIIADCSIKLPFKTRKGESLVSILEKIAIYIDSRKGGLIKEEIEAIASLVNSIHVTDLDKDIIGDRNGINKVFKVRFNYVSGTTEVYLGGLRLQPGVHYDYLETGDKTITLNYAPEPNQNLLIKYIKTI